MRKLLIAALDLLQCHDIGLRFGEPFEQVGEPLRNSVDIEGRKFHAIELFGEVLGIVHRDVDSACLQQCPARRT